MFKPISISLSPNTEKDDISLALKLLISPKKWINGTAVKKLEAWFKKYLNIENVYAINSGRAALYTILKASGIGPGDEVLIQGYTCVAVPDPIMWSGAKPIYVDINPETLNISAEDISRKASKRTKAIVVQHTFGLPADMKQILKVAEDNNMVVIEDCAHSLGANYNGKKIGTLGDVSFFSFGRDKVISSVYGGIIATPNKELGEKINMEIEKLKTPNKSWVVQQLIHPIIINIAIPIYGFLNLGKIVIEIAKRLKLISMAVYKSEKEGGKPDFVDYRMPNALAELALKQLNKLEKFNNHRVKIADIYNRDLQKINYEGFKLPPIQKEQIFLRFTVRSERAEELIKSARRKNILLGDWYRTPIAPYGVNYKKIHYASASCPIAETISLKSINLPTGPNISEKDANAIVNFILKQYGYGN